MKYIMYFVFVIGALLTFISITNFINKPLSHVPEVKNGVLDLRQENNLHDSLVTLDGTWDFYWQKFTHSDENVDLSSEEKTSIVVPSSWQFANTEEKNISNLGYGTYQLQILIPDDYIDQTLGLYIPSVATAYKLWINDELMLSNGMIATNSDDMVPVNYARTSYFQPGDTVIHVTLEVANFSQRKGGLWESIQFGTANEISLLKEKNIALQLMIVGSFFIMGIHNIFIFVLRRRLLYPLFLGILCLLFAMRTLVVGETFLLNIFPTFPWELQVKLEYLPVVFGLPLLVKYINDFYEEDKFIIFERIVFVISLLFVFIVLVTPAIVYTKYLILFLTVVPVTLIYFGYLFLKAFFEKRPASLFTLVGFTIFIVTVFNDSLYFLDFTNNGMYLSSGFFIFILSQTLAQAIRFSETHDQVENLSEELMEANRSLEKKVEDRTKKLALLYAKLRESEHERKNLMSDLAHEISKPLTLIKGYSEAMIDKKLPPEKDYLQTIHHNANISERLIHDLSELSKLETRQLTMIYQKIKLKNYPNHIYQNHQLTIENRGKNFIWKNQNEWIVQVPNDAYIYIDPDRMNQVFINIIENALIHTEDGENIYLEVEWHASAHADNEMALTEMAATTENDQTFPGEIIGECIIKIIDEGRGIPNEDIPLIFNRLYRGAYNQEGVNSRGLGLAISKEIVELQGGTIWVESKVDEGSIFFISIPVYH